MQRHKKRFARKLNRVMAYIYVPLLFSFLAYGVTYLMASDVINLTANLISFISADSAPDFNTEYNSVFVKNSVEIIEEDDGVETVKRSDVVMAEYGQLYAYVRCTRIALDAPIYMGDDYDILSIGVGQSFASFQPGFDRVIVLCAHNNTFFNPFKNIEVGDIVDIETSYGTYSYEIKETKVINETQTDAIDYSLDHEQLVMYTCYPFDMLSHTPYRFIVYADRISGPVFVD